MTKESVKFAMPGFAEDVATTFPKVKKATAKGTKNLVSISTGGIINPNEWEDYDPEDNAGGDYV